MAEINNLGHVWTPEGVKMDPGKIADIKKIPSLPTPINTERVRRFLHFTNYLTKFMPNVAAVSKPLRQLLQKDAKFEWKSAQ